MSHHEPQVPETTQQHDAEDEGIAYGKVVGVGVVSLVIFAIGILWSTQILHTSTKEFAPTGINELPKPRHTYEVGMVNVAPFEGDRRAADKIAAQRKHLSSYGWVDKKKGVIHVPVEKVIEQMVRENGR